MPHEAEFCIMFIIKQIHRSNMLIKCVCVCADSHNNLLINFSHQAMAVGIHWVLPASAVSANNEDQ